jgi:hypothetical protein
VNAGASGVAKLRLDGVGGVYDDGGGGAGQVLYRQASVMSQADCSVFAVFRLLTVTVASLFLASRMVDNANGYEGGYNLSLGQWEIYKRQGGVSALQVSLVEAFPAGTARSVELRIAGSTITLWVDSVLKLTKVDATFGAAGYSGLVGLAPATDTAATGMHAEQWQTWLP